MLKNQCQIFHKVGVSFYLRLGLKQKNTWHIRIYSIIQKRIKAEKNNDKDVQINE